MQESSPSAAETDPEDLGGAQPKHRRGLPRWLRIALGSSLGLVGLLAVVGGVAVWRLSSEPVRLDFLTPHLEQAFDLEDRGLSIDVGETLLMWPGWPSDLELRTRKVSVMDREGGELASLPDASVNLSMRALLQGTIAPTSIELIGPELALVRADDGSLSLGVESTVPEAESDAGAPSDAASDEARSAALQRLIDGLLIEPDPEQALSFLSSIRIRDGRLSVTERSLGQTFQASDLVVELRRQAPGIDGALSLRLDLPDAPVEIEAAFTYDKSDGAIDLAGSFADLNPAALPGDWPGASELRSLALPLEGSLALTLAGGGGLDSATFDVTGGAGLLDLGDRLPEPRPVRALQLTGTFDGLAKRLDLQSASLDFGTSEAPGPELEASGTVTQLDAGADIEGKMRVAGLAVDDFPLYWPRGLDEGGRTWIVENVKNGVVEEANIEVALRRRDGAEDELERFGGDLRYRDLAVHYLRPMPPATGLSGTATFDVSAIRFQVAGGRSGTIELGPSEAVIDGLDRPEVEQLSVTFPASGPLRDILALLNHERIKLLENIELDPASTAGTARATTTFSFPLLDALTFDEVVVSSEAEAEGIAVQSLLLGQDASDGRLALSLNNEGMRVSGSLRLGDVPMELDWRETFAATEPLRSRYEVLVPALDEAGWRRFGLDGVDGLSGAVSASLVAEARRDGTTAIQVAANLEQAGLDVPEIAWSKPVGQAGSASVTLLLRDGRLTEISELEASADNLALKGSGRFDERGADLASLALSELRFDGTALTDVLLSRGAGGNALSIGGGVLDAEPILEGLLAADEASPDPESADPPLRLKAKNLEVVRLGEARYLERVSFDLERIDDAWHRVQLAGQVPRSLWRRNAEPSDEETAAAGAVRTFNVDYRPVEQGRHSLSVQADDTGATLRALDLLDEMEGGVLRIAGQSLPGRPLQASLKLENFTLVDPPVLGRLLLLTSLAGIVEGLSSEGLTFESLTGDLVLSDGQVTSEGLRAMGPSLGMTTRGTFDYGQDKLDLSGSIAPAYGINRVVKNLPLIGDILTGEEGDGLVAFTYQVNGSIEEPDVSVNPLSALTPDWLERTFGGTTEGE